MIEIANKKIQKMKLPLFEKILKNIPQIKNLTL